ncbi:MAG: VOC family protein [Bryobacterales bacterium]|nr:VOC family protein [Bryobacterales bacterium]
MIRVVPILLSADFARSLHFYKNILGFEVVDRTEHRGSDDWLYMRLGDAEMIITASGEAPDAIDITSRDRKAAYYFFVEGVRDVREKILEAGGQPSPIQANRAAMDEFELLDPDGHVLVFGESFR